MRWFTIIGKTARRAICQLPARDAVYCVLTVVGFTSVSLGIYTSGIGRISDAYHARKK